MNVNNLIRKGKTNMSQYSNFVNENRDAIIAMLNSEVRDMNVTVKKGLVNRIQEMLTPIPFHYDARDGEMIPNGPINMDLPLNDFLNTEVNSNGFSYKDILSQYTTKTSEIITSDVIKNFLQHKFSIVLSDDEFDTIKMECGNFNDIKNSSDIRKLATVDEAIKHFKLNEMSLVSLMRE